MSSEKKASRPTISCRENGALIVKGLPEMKGAGGKTMELKKVTALCRCGKSGNRPFCDGSHSKVGFSSARESDGAWDKRESYRGGEIEIHDNRGICSHAGYCTGGLPKTFMMATEPWIGPDNSPKGEVIETVQRCPSGALSYSLAGREYRGQEREPMIEASPNGPYIVTGGIEMEEQPPGEGASTEHYALCRCGGSKNKPRCDGAHWHINFRDDNRYRVAVAGELPENAPVAAQVEGVELVLVRQGEEVRVLSGRCLHQGALLAEGSVEQGQLVCPLHGWSYNLSSGVLEDDAAICLKVLTTWIENGEVLIDLDEVKALREEDAAQESKPPEPTAEEPRLGYIHRLATEGLEKTGHHGPMAAMGVPRNQLPSWDELQFVTAQLHRLPLLDDTPVKTELVIGPGAKKPLRLELPIFVSDMSFGALSLEAKVALARGAELAGTGICSGEGGMLPEEQAENSRYFYELASARFGFKWELLKGVQAFHFKGGQAAKTGTGGHLPGEKVTEKIARVRGLKPGEDAISPARFPDLVELDDFSKVVAKVREVTGGIPVGFKLSAQHIEQDIEAAVRVGVDYIILDGRGGGTGAAPLIFRDNISVPTLAALPRARRHLNKIGAQSVTLIVTGGLRTPEDFAKALALGADGVAIGNSAMQAIGCIATRACNTNNCPVGIATQKEHLRQLLNVEQAAANLNRFLRSAVSLMSTLARACGHTRLSDFSTNDLTTWKREIAHLTGVSYGGVGGD